MSNIYGFVVIFKRVITSLNIIKPNWLVFVIETLCELDKTKI
jgi:hypothetical protein